MTFVADESVDRQIVDSLRGLGHEILSIAETAPGIADKQVLNRTRNTRSVLLTADKDFGELIFRQRRLHSGIVLLRLAELVTADGKKFIINSVLSESSAPAPVPITVVLNWTALLKK